MKAPLAQESVGANPTDLGGGNGNKRHFLLDGRGVPLSLVVTGVNRHDVSQLEAVLDAIVVEQPNPPLRRNKHLGAGAGYTGAPTLKVIADQGNISHVKARGQEAIEFKRELQKKRLDDGLSKSHTVG